MSVPKCIWSGRRKKKSKKKKLRSYRLAATRSDFDTLFERTWPGRVSKFFHGHLRFPSPPSSFPFPFLAPASGQCAISVRQTENHNGNAPQSSSGSYECLLCRVLAEPSSVVVCSKWLSDCPSPRRFCGNAPPLLPQGSRCYQCRITDRARNRCVRYGRRQVGIGRSAWKRIVKRPVQHRRP